MLFSRERILTDVLEAIYKMSLEESIKLWNRTFPPEEKISKETFKNKTIKEIEILQEEISMIISDEISAYSNEELLEIYQQLFDDEIDIVDDIGISYEEEM